MTKRDPKSMFNLTKAVPNHANRARDSRNGTTEQKRSGLKRKRKFSDGEMNSKRTLATHRLKFSLFHAIKSSIQKHTSLS